MKLKTPITVIILLAITAFGSTLYWNIANKNEGTYVYNPNQKEVIVIKDNDFLDKVVGFSTILTGCASIIVGLVSCRIMRKQNKREEDIFQAQQKEHQPSFAITITSSKYDTTCAYNDHEEISITNIGERVLEIDSIIINSFIEFKYSDLSNGKQFHSYLPLEYYFKNFHMTGKLTDEVAKSHCDYSDNLKEYYRIDSSINDDSDKHDFISIDRVHLIAISYTDIYGIKHTLHFMGNSLIDEKTYNSIKETAANDYKEKDCSIKFKLSKVNRNTFFNFCTRLKRR